MPRYILPKYDITSSNQSSQTTIKHERTTRIVFITADYVSYAPEIVMDLSQKVNKPARIGVG